MEDNYGSQNSLRMRKNSLRQLQPVRLQRAGEGSVHHYTCTVYCTTIKCWYIIENTHLGKVKAWWGRTFYLNRITCIQIMKTVSQTA